VRRKINRLRETMRVMLVKLSNVEIIIYLKESECNTRCHIFLSLDIAGIAG
jgi:hypothetical protein